MRFQLYSALAVAFFLPMAASADEKVELGKLRGEYKVVSIQRGGKNAPDSVLKSQLRIEGNRLTIVSTLDGAERKSVITAAIDDSKTPKQIDLSKEGTKRYLGIYKFDGKLLTICYDRVGKDATRPEKFESPADSTVILMVFEKTK